MGRELVVLIEQMAKDKRVTPKKLIEMVESAVLAAAKKKYGFLDDIQVRFDTETGEIEATSLKTVVEQVKHSHTEIALEEAKKLDEAAEIGDTIGSFLEVSDFGRIAAQAAKQVMLAHVRRAEWEAVEQEYAGRKGEILSGVIVGREHRNYLVELGKTEALLPYSEQIPREEYGRGDRIRAYLVDVRASFHGPQVILSRSHPQFVAKLFEMEVPDIADGVVVIKGIAREAGDRTKIAVYSNDSAVDPVGACVGVKGCRVQAVVRELRGEKIDIITWTDDPQTFIGEALSPAVVEKVGINAAEKSVLVVVSDQQLSLAIGKRGQNVRIAAKLTGWKIDIINQGQYQKERDQEIAAALFAPESSPIPSNEANPLPQETSEEVPVANA